MLINRHISTIYNNVVCYFFVGDDMKVKVFDEEHEKDLEEAINEFLDGEVEVIDIKYQVAICGLGDEQIFCFSAMIIYN